MPRLRELERKDISEINLWRNRHEVIDMLGAPFRYINEEIDLKWYEDYMCKRNNTVRCAIVGEEIDKILGLASLTDVDSINRSAQFHIMIGSKENWDRGIGTFAVSQMLRHAFFNLNLERVWLTVLKSNDRARHLYEKMGFVYEGELRRAVYKCGHYEDMLVYSILRNEYDRTGKEHTFSLRGGGK